MPPHFGHGCGVVIRIGPCGGDADEVGVWAGVEVGDDEVTGSAVINLASGEDGGRLAAAFCFSAISAALASSIIRSHNEARDSAMMSKLHSSTLAEQCEKDDSY